MVGAVGIGLKATLKTRKLLILLSEKNDKNTEFTQVRYTRGTRRNPPQTPSEEDAGQLRRANLSFLSEVNCAGTFGFVPNDHAIIRVAS